jgi:hypothetical protein
MSFDNSLKFVLFRCWVWTDVNRKRQHYGKGAALPDFTLQDNLTAQKVSHEIYTSGTLL